MRYIDLMGGQKPHLLVHTTNNMGAETEVQYAASTKFYCRTAKKADPWVTGCRFRSMSSSGSRTAISSPTPRSSRTYRYRHGYYDGVEREFRGFAYVEQRDAEFGRSAQFDLPPVVTKTWFHNGAFLEEGRLEAYFKDGNQEFFSGDAQASFLPDPALPSDLTVEEMREAARALEGQHPAPGGLCRRRHRQGGAAIQRVRAKLPVTCLQPRGPNRHAVFFTHPQRDASTTTTSAIRPIRASATR